MKLRPLRLILTGIGALILAFLFYLGAVMGQPQTDHAYVPAKPLPSEAPARSITELQELQELVREFPAPVLLSMSGTGLTLEGAASYSVKVTGGYGRAMRLVYHDADGNRLQVESVYPPSADSLLQGNGYTFSSAGGHTVAGQKTARMENSTSIRLHFSTDKGLYLITIPKEASGRISSLVRPLSLLSLN